MHYWTHQIKVQAKGGEIMPSYFFCIIRERRQKRSCYFIDKGVYPYPRKKGLAVVTITGKEIKQRRCPLWQHTREGTIFHYQKHEQDDHVFFKPSWTANSPLLASMRW